ncbi:pleckstrin homology domain-containing family A member 4-like [Cuculus canorus]|uniref:pleckstrin homology domain-containing family A member 4-like n=1 Tax=Cuculus canorus TaxID=55661 RepID=UPI0023AA9330|nr:pleckstrin homology domain-containing family A member 4-like [Cuculus canorus]
MAEEPPRTGAGTQPCRAVARVHTFGKGERALRRDPHTPPSMRGWLHKQDSSGLRLWKRRWFVLVDLCLYYYRDSSEQRVRGGLPLPGYEIRVLHPTPRAPRFPFTAEHPGMRTYCLGAETPEELQAWVCALRRGAAPLPSSPRSLSLQEPQSGGTPSPPLPAHPLVWRSLCPPSVELRGLPMPSPRHPPVPLPPLNKEAPPARGEPRRTEAELKPRPRGALANQQPFLPAAAGGGRGGARPRDQSAAACSGCLF